MATELRVLVTCPDEDEDGKEPAECILQVMDGMLSISRYFLHKDCRYWLTWRYRLYRGPWPLQLALTPLCAFNGILFSKSDVEWLGTETDQPRLRVTPLVPPEFWVEVHFRSRADALTVAGLVDRFWQPPARRGWVSLVRRWPELFAAPFFMIPFGIGFTQRNQFYIATGLIAFFAFVMTGMVLGVRRNTRVPESFKREI